MTDSQLPRFEVFVQEREDGPHLHYGSVHAADGELALLNARDVFSRRPECRSLWVVSADRLFRWTSQQLTEVWPPVPSAGRGSPFREAATPTPPFAKHPAAKAEGPPLQGEGEAFLVFGKLGHKGTHTYLGEVQAPDASAALALARADFGDRDVTSWWIAPARERRTSSPDEAGPWFEPALDKPFRDQAYYPVETFMRNLGRGRRQKAR